MYVLREDVQTLCVKFCNYFKFKQKPLALSKFVILIYIMSL